MTTHDGYISLPHKIRMRFTMYSLRPKMIVLPPWSFMSQNVYRTNILDKKLWGAGQSFWDGGSTFLNFFLFKSICMYMGGGRSKLSTHTLLILYVWVHSWAGIFGYKCSNSIAILQNWLFRDVSLLSCLSDGRY